MKVTCADLTVFVVDELQTTTTAPDHIYCIMTVTVPLTHLSSTKPTAAESSSRKTLNGLALAVAKAKRIVVVTGAGISCSSGIPDFRSSDGLYNLVKSRYPDVVMKGRDLFDAALFRDPMSSALFYTFMAELKTQIDGAHPAPVHDFLATLDAKGKLLRSYTQNIDGLEERAGLSAQEPNAGNTTAPRAKNVQLHGDIHRVRCTLCSASYPCDPEHIAQFRTGVPPDCPECIARSDARTARAARALKCGTLRPAIVLYDEPHPLGDHIGAVQTADLGKKPDMLIVMGTSLKVHGLRSLVKSFAKAVHSSRTDSSRALLHNVVFVNRTPPPPGEWAGILDYHVQGDADAWVAHVLGEWRKARPVDWEVQSTLDGIPRPLGKAGAGKEEKGKEKEIATGKGGAGKTGKPMGKKGKSKSAESENTPPEETTRFKIVLPAGKRKMRIGLSKSPARTMGRSVGGVGKSGVGRSVGVSRSPFLTPGKKSGIRIGLKRPAASPLTPRVQRQPRIDAVFTKSPRFPITREGSSASTPYPSTSASAQSSQLELVTSQTSSSQLELSTSAQSSQAPSSQTSRSSTQDSIFSSQDSQSTAASSLADLGEMECGASQSTVGPSSQNTVGPGTVEHEVESRPAPDTQDTIMASPPRSSSLPMKSPKRYLDGARLPPARCQSLGSGHLFANTPSFGQGSPWSSQPSGAFGQPGPSTSSSQPAPIRISSATGRPFARNASTSQLQRRVTQIPIPGRDFVVSSTGERISCTDSDSEEDIPLASQVSVTAPPRPSQSFMGSGARSVLGKQLAVELPTYRDSASPDKGKAMDEDSDSDEDLADAEPPRGLLFKTRDDDVIDVDPTTEESDGMSLDGAVEHMSLTRGEDTEVDVTGTDSGRERLMISPIKTRARRTKEAVAKRVTKKAPRARVAGIRSSQRLAVKASS